MNKLNKISKIALILLFIMLSTSFSYKVSALTMNYTILSTSTNPYWYCSEHGAPLPAANSSSNYYTSNGSPDDVGDEGTLLNSNISSLISTLGGGTTEVSAETYNALVGTTYSQSYLSPFWQVGDSYATAEETYI